MRLAQVTAITAGAGEWLDAPTLATVKRVVAGVLTIMVCDSQGDASPRWRYGRLPMPRRRMGCGLYMRFWTGQ